LIDYAQLLLLGAIAGFTIFLGLPLAILQNVSPRKKGFLNALSIGILLFLVIDVFSHAWNTATCVASSAFTRNAATCVASSTVAVNWSVADAATTATPPVAACAIRLCQLKAWPSTIRMSGLAIPLPHAAA